MDAADRAGLHGTTDVRPASSPVAVVTGPGPLPNTGGHAGGGARHDRGLAAAEDNQAIRGKRLQGMPHDAGPDALQGAQLGDQWHLVAGGQAPGLYGRCKHLGDLLPGRTAVARIDHQDRDVAVLGERPAGAGQFAVPLQPRVQLVEDGPADLPHLKVAQGRLDGAADESLVGLPRGYVPLRDGRVLVQELRDGRVGLGSSALRGFLQQPAEFDVRLLLSLGGGLEADLAPGERINPDIHGDTK